MEAFRLPSVFKPVGPPGVESEGQGEVMVLASISTSLHVNAGATAHEIKGQKDAKVRCFVRQSIYFGERNSTVCSCYLLMTA